MLQNKNIKKYKNTLERFRDYIFEKNNFLVCILTVFMLSSLFCMQIKLINWNRYLQINCIIRVYIILKKIWFIAFLYNRVFVQHMIDICLYLHIQIDLTNTLYTLMHTFKRHIESKLPAFHPYKNNRWGFQSSIGALGEGNIFRHCKL